jgi:conjugal transfer pilus assembly protein TraW
MANKFMIRYVVWCFGLMASQYTEAHAKDFGVVGQTFEIMEVDMLEYIKTRLGEMEQDGVLAQKQSEMKDRLGEYVNTPTPVEGLIGTTNPKVWVFDPSYILQEDIKDQDGDIIHKKGTVVNPLDTVALPVNLLFIDGDSKEQVNWALNYSKSDICKIILVKGQPMELMKSHKLRVYFDQKGILIGRFGITQTPALVKQKGNKLLIEEFKVGGN